MNYEKFLNQQLKWVRKHGTVESVEKHNWWIAEIEKLGKREAAEFPAQNAVIAEQTEQAA